MVTHPSCLDCVKPLGAMNDDAYPTSSFWSRVYLCPFCRTHRYKSEAHAMARIHAAMDKARAQQSSSALTPAPVS